MVAAAPLAPAPAWAAVRAAPADARGRRLLASRACRRGDVLLREGPLLLWGPDARADARAAGGDALEAVGEALGGWDALAARAAFRRLPAAERHAVLDLVGGDGDAAADALLAAQGLCEESPELAQALGHEEGVAEYAELAGIVAANATENSDGRRALYAALSMANHSCAPNAAWRTAEAAAGEKELVLIARSAAAGEELCISYLPERDLFLLGHEARRRRLQEGRGFDCLCERCGAGERAGESAGERELAALSEDLVNGGRLRAMPRDKAEAVQRCKDLGRQLRRLDELWPPASALKASLWSAFAELLCACGAPQALKEGAAQRALEESRPCVGPRAWTEQARQLQERLEAAPLQPPSAQAAAEVPEAPGSATAAAAAPLPPAESPGPGEVEAAEAAEQLD